MSRGKVYPNAMRTFLYEHGKDYTARELIPIIKEKFDIEMSLKEAQNYLWRHKIEHKFEHPCRSHTNKGLPIGSERRKSDGMWQIKVAPHKWEYKQRLIYEKYHNVKLPDDVYVIFLDQNRDNFDINNLMAISRRESAYMANAKVFSENKEITKTGVKLAKLNIKIKDIKEDKNNEYKYRN